MSLLQSFLVLTVFASLAQTINFSHKRVQGASPTRLFTKGNPFKRCADDWFIHNNYCYKVSLLSLQWKEALANCVADLSSLVSITSADEQQFVKKILADTKETVWTGAIRVQNQGFEWPDGQTLKYDNWFPEQPTRLGNCIEVVPLEDFKWYATTCETKKTFICQKAAAVKPPPGEAFHFQQTRPLKHDHTFVGQRHSDFRNVHTPRNPFHGQQTRPLNHDPTHTGFLNVHRPPSYHFQPSYHHYQP